MTPPLIRDEKGMKNKGLIWVGYSFQRRGHISEKSKRLFTHIHESPLGDSFIGDQGRGHRNGWASPGPLGPWFPYLVPYLVPYN